MFFERVKKHVGVNVKPRHWVGCVGGGCYDFHYTENKPACAVLQLLSLSCHCNYASFFSALIILEVFLVTAQVVAFSFIQHTSDIRAIIKIYVRQK